MSVFVCKRNFWWRQIWRHLQVTMLQCFTKLSNGLVGWSIRMILCQKLRNCVLHLSKFFRQNYWLLFFPNTVYMNACVGCSLQEHFLAPQALVPSSMGMGRNSCKFTPEKNNNWQYGVLFLNELPKRRVVTIQSVEHSLLLNARIVVWKRVGGLGRWEKLIP